MWMTTPGRHQCGNPGCPRHWMRLPSGCWPKTRGSACQRRRPSRPARGAEPRRYGRAHHPHEDVVPSGLSHRRFRGPTRAEVVLAGALAAALVAWRAVLLSGTTGHAAPRARPSVPPSASQHPPTSRPTAPKAHKSARPRPALTRPPRPGPTRPARPGPTRPARPRPTRPAAGRANALPPVAAAAATVVGDLEAGSLLGRWPRLRARTCTTTSSHCCSARRTNPSRSSSNTRSSCSLMTSTASKGKSPATPPSRSAARAPRPRRRCRRRIAAGAWPASAVSPLPVLALHPRSGGRLARHGDPVCPQPCIASGLPGLGKRPGFTGLGSQRVRAIA
jgi:hypothetical protein